MHVLVQSGPDNLFGRSVQARVHDLHASITQPASHDLCTPVMSIQAWFCHQDSNAVYTAHPKTPLAITMR